MTFTYNASNLGTSARDRIRFRLGDTNSSDPGLQDEEIDYLLNVAGSESSALVQGIDSLISKYSREVTRSVGPVSVQLSERVKQLHDLRMLIVNSPTFVGIPIPLSPGIFQSETVLLEENSDLILSPFSSDDGIFVEHRTDRERE